MRKKVTIIASLILVAAIAAIVTACNQKEEDSQLVDQSGILYELDRYNNDLVCSDATRAKQSEAMEIAEYDAKWAFKGGKIGRTIGSLFGGKGKLIGTISGGVIFGGIASYIRYEESSERTEHTTFSMTDIKAIPSLDSFEASYVVSKELISPGDYSMGVEAGLDSCAINVGLQHNKVLDVVDGIDEEGDAQSWIARLDDLEKQIMSHKDFRQGYDSVMNDTDNTIGNSKNTADKIMKLFMEAVSKCNGKKDIISVVSYYSHTVDLTNELSEDDKSNLYMGFSVMLYSYDYWTQKLESELN